MSRRSIGRNHHRDTTCGGAVPCPGLLSDGRRPEPGHDASHLSEVYPHRSVELRETGWTVGVRNRKIGRIHAMGLLICSLRDPDVTTTRRSRIISDESAIATDGEERRGDEPLSHQYGKRHTSGPIIVRWGSGMMRSHSMQRTRAARCSSSVTRSEIMRPCIQMRGRRIGRVRILRICMRPHAAVAFGVD
jgi:hypothetical protein